MNIFRIYEHPTTLLKSISFPLVMPFITLEFAQRRSAECAAEIKLTILFSASCYYDADE